MVRLSARRRHHVLRFRLQAHMSHLIRGGPLLSYPTAWHQDGAAEMGRSWYSALAGLPITRCSKSPLLVLDNDTRAMYCHVGNQFPTMTLGFQRTSLPYYVQF